jgi:hypothetical protein
MIEKQQKENIPYVSEDDSEANGTTSKNYLVLSSSTIVTTTKYIFKMLKVVFTVFSITVKCVN